VEVACAALEPIVVLDWMAPARALLMANRTDDPGALDLDYGSQV
jgi:hypothetical protein